MKSIIILGAGESGIGCALLAQSRGYNVFVSDSNNIQESTSQIIELLGCDESEIVKISAKKGEGIDNIFNAIINNTKSGNTITVSNIMARRTDAKGTATRSLPPLVLKIK